MAHRPTSNTWAATAATQIEAREDRGNEESEEAEEKESAQRLCFGTSIGPVRLVDILDYAIAVAI